MDNWEDAVRWFRTQPEFAQAVYDNYFDLPVRNAAIRYAQSEEFAEVSRLLGPGSGKTVLDIGAGNGIATFALAKCGWQVTAVEPNPSHEVGIGAIRALSKEVEASLSLIQCNGEQLLCNDNTFDAVLGRQVFHHAASLETMTKETARVLRPRGVLLAIREHVVDNEEQLAAFRAAHPLHHRYGGESAYPVSVYMNAFQSAGLRVRQFWGPLESILNFYPGTEAERQRQLEEIIKASWGGAGKWFRRFSCFRAMQRRTATQMDRTPGRLFSFMVEKP